MLAALAVPVVADVVSAHRLGWRPMGDTATIVRRAADVLSSNSPSLGMLSDFVVWSPGTYVYHPGPLVFWSMAPTSLLFGSSGLGALVGAAMVRLVALGLVVWAANRRAGATGAVAATVAILAVDVYYAPLSLYEPLNPAMAIWPFLALIFLSWSVLDGDLWALPFAVATASFAVQAELSFGPATVALVAMVVVHLARRWRQADAAERRHGRRPLVAAVTVAIVCWIAPLLQAVRASGGNLRALIDAAGSGALPAGGARAVVNEAVGALTNPVGGLLAIATVAVATGWLRHRHGPDRALARTAAVTAVGLVAWMWTRPATTSDYHQPLVALQAFWLFVLALSAIRWGRGRVAASRRPYVGRAAAAFAVLALVVVVVLAGVRPEIIVERRSHPLFVDVMSAPPALAALVRARVDPTRGAYELRAESSYDNAVTLGLLLVLRDRGFRLHVADGNAAYLGRGVDAHHHHDVATLWVTDSRVVGPPAPGARLVARWWPPPDAQRRQADVAAQIEQAVRRAGRVVLTASGQQQVAQFVRGWQRTIDPAQLRDPRLLADAPPALIQILYAYDMVQSPPLDQALSLTVRQHQSLHPVGVWVTGCAPSGDGSPSCPP